MSIHIINETRIVSTSKRKYPCPCCDQRDTRENLVIHIRDDHEDLIPEGFTAARVVFNMINSKTEGKCIVCRGKTEWNETSWRYDRICSDQCKEKYSKNVDKNMVNKYGRTHLLNDPEQQKKMLANRSISGTYVFQDGGVMTYTGSYEKSLLEFMDTILNIPSKDIQMPGPTYKYKFDGEDHFWITDLLYIPFNLVFDVKDGGSNPNTHPNFEIDRRKQKEKEDTIIKAKKHNYIRLTDNDFEQLMQAMTEIKMSMLDEEDTKERIVHINEAMIGTISSSDEPHAYLVPYSSNTMNIEGIGMMKDLMMTSIFDVGTDSRVITKSVDDFDDKYYAIFETTSDKDLDKYNQLLSEAQNGTIVEGGINHIPKLFSNTPMDRAEDILLSEDVELVTVGYDMTNLDIWKDVESITKYSSLPPVDGLIDITADVDGVIDGIVILECEDGVFASCDKNNMRTPFYPNIDSIPRHMQFLLRRM